MKKHYLLSALLLCVVALLPAQNQENANRQQPTASAAGEQKKTAERIVPPSDGSNPVLAKLYAPGGPFAAFKPEQEILTKRGRNTKHFQIGETNYSAVVSSGLTHYWENGMWNTSSNDIAKLSDPAYAYGNINNPAKVYFGKNLGTGLKMACPKDIVFKGFSPSSISAYDGARRLIAPLHQANTTATPVLNESNTTLLQYAQVYPFSAYDIEQRCNNFKTQYVIDQNIFNQLPQNTEYVAFAEKMEIPAGATVEYRYENGKSNGILIKLNEEIIFTYTNARYWSDTTGHAKRSRGGRAKIDYSLNGSTLEMRMMVPAEWLNSPDTKYPVTIDPIADLYSYDMQYYGNANSGTYGVPNVYNSAYASSGSYRNNGGWSGDYVLVGWVDDCLGGNDGSNAIERALIYAAEFILFAIEWITENELRIETYFGLGGFWDFFSEWETRVHGYAKFPLPNTIAHPSSLGSLGQVPPLYDDTLPTRACIHSTELILEQEGIWDGGGNRGMHFDIVAQSFDPQYYVHPTLGLNDPNGIGGRIQNPSGSYLYVSSYGATNGSYCPNNFPAYTQYTGSHTINVGSNQMDDYLSTRAQTSYASGGNFVTFTFENVCRAEDKENDETYVIPFRGYSFGSTGPHLRINYNYSPGSETDDAIAVNSVTCPFTYTDTKDNNPVQCLTNSRSGVVSGVTYGTADDWFYQLNVTGTDSSDVVITTVNSSPPEISTNLYLFRSTDLVNPIAYIYTPAPNTAPTVYSVSGLPFTNNTTAYLYSGINHYRGAMTVRLAPGSYHLMVETSNGYSPQNVTTNISVVQPVLGTITHSQVGVISLPSDSTIDFCGTTGGTLTVTGGTGSIVWEVAPRNNPTAWVAWPGASGTATSPAIDRTGSDAFPENTASGASNDYAFIRMRRTTSPSCPTRQQSFIVNNRYNPPVDSLEMFPTGGVACAGGMALVAIFPNGNLPNLNGRVEFMGPEYGGIISWLDNPLPNPPTNENIPEASILANSDGDYNDSVFYYPNLPVDIGYTYFARYNPVADFTDAQLGNLTSLAVGCPGRPDTTNFVSKQATFDIIAAPTSPNIGQFLPGIGSSICVDQPLSMKGAATGGNPGIDCNTIEYAWSTDGINWTGGLAALPSYPYNIVTPNIAGANYSGPFFVGARRKCGTAYYPTLNSYGCTAPLEYDTIGYWNVIPNPTNPTTWTALPALTNVCVGHPLSVTAATGGEPGVNCKVLYRISLDGGATWDTTSSQGQAVPVLGTAALGTTIVQVKRGHCQNGCTEPDWINMASWTVVADPTAFTTTSNPSPNQDTVCEGTAVAITSDPSGGNPGINCSIEYGYSLSSSATGPEVFTNNTYPSFAAVYNGGGYNKIYARRVNCQTACDAPTPWSVVAEWAVTTGVIEDFGVAQVPFTPTACEGTPLSIENFFENATYTCYYDFRYSEDNGATWDTIGINMDFSTVSGIMPYPINASPTVGTYIVQARRADCTGLSCTFAPQPYETVASWVVVPEPLLGKTPAAPIDMGTIACTPVSDVQNPGYPGANSTCFYDDQVGMWYEDIFYRFEITAAANVDVTLCNTTVADLNVTQFPFTYVEIFDSATYTSQGWDDGGTNTNSPCFGTGFAHVTASLGPGVYYVMVEGALLDMNINGGDFNGGFDITTQISYSLPSPANFISSGKDVVCYNATGEPYSVLPYGGNYEWFAPPGATIASGQYTDNVTIDFGTATGDTVICRETYGTCTVDYILPITTVVAQPPVVTADLSCHSDTGKVIVATVSGVGDIYYRVDVDPVLGNLGTQYTAPLSINTATPDTFYYNFVSFGNDGTQNCISPVTRDTVEVNPLPADVIVTPSGTPAVSGWCGPVTLNATGGSGGTIHWLNSVPTALPPVATASATEVVTATDDYYFRSINTTTGCMSDTTRVDVLINSLPVAPGLSNIAPWCGPTTVFASESVNGDTLYYLGNSVGGPSNIISDGSEAVNNPGDYYFVSQNLTTGCRSTTATATYPVGVKPDVPTITPTPANASECFGGTVTLTASGGTGVIRWLSLDSLGLPGAAGAVQVVDTTGYYYFRTRSADGCWSNAVQILATIHGEIATPTLSYTTGGSGDTCNDNTQLFGTANAGETAWFQGTTSGGTSVADNSPANITTPGTNTYYYRVRNNTTSCWSDEASMELTVYERPSNPVATSGTGCASDTLNATTNVGVVYHFGTTNTNTGNLVPIVTQTEGTHYFRAFNNGCWSLASGTVVADTFRIPAVPTVGTGTAANGLGYHCGNVVFFATDSATRPDNGVSYWQGALVNGVATTVPPIFERNVTGSGTYYFRAKDPNTNCWSNPTGTTVQVNPAINISVALDGCMMGTTTNQKENVVITTTGGTPPHSISETTLGALTPIGSQVSSAVKVFPIPIPGPSDPQNPTYYFQTTDAVGCVKSAANFVFTPTYISDIPHDQNPAVSALSSDTVSCYSKGLNGWLNFRERSSPDRIFMSINDNNQDLGNVTVIVYYEPSEPTIGNIHTPATCNTEPMKALRRHFAVFPSTQPTNPVGVRLFFSDDEVASLVTATAVPTTNCDSSDVINVKEDLHVIKYHASAGNTDLENHLWSDNDAAGIYTLFGPNAAQSRALNADGTFQSMFTNVSGPHGRHYADVQTSDLSEFWLGGSNDEGSPLPVEMIFLEADPIDNSYIRVRWATATETNNDGFQVERSTDAQNWATIGWVDGQGDANGNSTVQLNYTHNDMNVLPNVRYYYRLKQVDRDAQFEYTGIVSAMITGEAIFTVKDFMPNPAVDKASLAVIASGEQEISIDLYNVIGEKVQARVTQLHKGGNLIDFDVSLLASGTYTAIVSSANDIHTRKLVITR